LEEGGADAVEKRSRDYNFDENNENVENVENVESFKTFRSLSDTLDDQTIDKLLDQYLASLGSSNDESSDSDFENDLKERRRKVKAASIMNLLTDDLMEHLKFKPSDKSDERKEPQLKKANQIDKDEL
jgi:hypothetical protein